MTEKQEQVLQRLMRAIYEAINASPAFNEAIDEMPGVGLRPLLGIQIQVQMDNDPPKAPEGKNIDADFLRLLRIRPDLEVR